MYIQKASILTFTAATTGNITGNGNSHPHLPFPPPSCRNPRAPHVSGAVISPASATSPAPRVLTTFLCSVPTVLASPQPTLFATTTAVSVHISVIGLRHLLTFEVVPKTEHVLLGRVQLRVRPQAPETWIVGIALRDGSAWAAWGGREEREDAEANPKSCGGRKVVRGNGLGLLVHRRSVWSNQEYISQTQHGLIIWDEECCWFWCTTC